MTTISPPDPRLELQKLTVSPVTGMDANVAVPGSKSYTNRYLAIAALSGLETVIEGALLSDDTIYLARAIEAFGHVRAEIDTAAASIRIVPTGKPMRAPAEEIYVGGAGTPLRFLVSLAGHASGTTVITGNSRMQERPVGDLLTSLPPLGVEAVAVRGNGCPPVRVTGGNFRGGATEINGTVSSQFTSSLLISAARAAQDTHITVVGNLISRPYINMTISALAEMGVHVAREGYRKFSVNAGQKFRGGTVRVEPDASGMSYFLAAAAITGGRVAINGIGARSCQGDVGLIRALKTMGCHIDLGDDWVTVTGGALHGIDIDMGGMPDVAPTLAVVAAFARGSTRITGIGSLRVKECDRIAAVTTELRKMGVTVEEFPDALHITGGTPHSAVIDTYDDHRIAMAFAVTGLQIPGVTIRDPGCVAKSFPTFWQCLDGLHPAGQAAS